MADFIAGEPVTQNGTGSGGHSRQSSMSSERSQGQDKENRSTNALPCGRDSDDGGSDVSSGQLILRDGGRLGEESGTENAGFSPACHGVTKGGEGVKGGGDGQSLEIPPRQPSGSGTGTGTARHKVSKSGNLASSIPEVEITIPNDGCLASFSADAMATFFRHMRLEDRLVNHLHRNGLDGRKFGRLKDSDLDNLHLNNPVMAYFRDRTAPAVNKKTKQRLPFVL